MERLNFINQSVGGCLVGGARGDSVGVVASADNAVTS